MNIDSDDWQVEGDLVYKLHNDKRGQRCNEFWFGISADREVNPKEKEELAEKICALLNAARST